MLNKCKLLFNLRDVPDANLVEQLCFNLIKKVVVEFGFNLIKKVVTESKLGLSRERLCF